MRFDEIGEWSRIKLDIVEKYSRAYSDVMSNQQFRCHYVDAFSGAGVHINRDTQEMVSGSPLRVLEVADCFCGHYLIDLDSEKADFIRNLCGQLYQTKQVQVYEGDCNDVITDILSDKHYRNYDRVLCLLDPYGLHLNWDVINIMGGKEIVDLILNFPVMDMNRNAIWHDHERVLEANKQRMTRFWGDESWLDVAYGPSPQSNMFDDSPQEKQTNETIANAFRDRLRTVAGFQYVPPPIPLNNSRNATVYYLFFASANRTANRIALDIFNKYRRE